MCIPLQLALFLPSLWCFFAVAGPAAAVVVVPTLLLPVVVAAVVVVVVVAVVVAAATVAAAVVAVAAAAVSVALQLPVAPVVHRFGSPGHSSGPFVAARARFDYSLLLQSGPDLPLLVEAPYLRQASY